MNANRDLLQLQICDCKSEMFFCLSRRDNFNVLFDTKLISIRLDKYGFSTASYRVFVDVINYYLRVFFDKLNLTI